MLAKNIEALQVIEKGGCEAWFAKRMEQRHNIILPAKNQRRALTCCHIATSCSNTIYFDIYSFQNCESPKDGFLTNVRGSSEIVDFRYVYNFETIFRGPCGIHQNSYFNTVAWIGDFIECAGSAHCKSSHQLQSGRTLSSNP